MSKAQSPGGPHSHKLSSEQRHERDCNVCRHAEREQIEREWIGWGDTTRIAKQYRLSPDSLYRHAHAQGLFAKRQRNVRKALERIIEKAEVVHFNAASVVAAVQAYAKINSQGQWIDRSESVNLNELFDRMTRDELDAYARKWTITAFRLGKQPFQRDRVWRLRTQILSFASRRTRFR
jgi:hypothetical protein